MIPTQSKTDIDLTKDQSDNVKPGNVKPGKQSSSDRDGQSRSAALRPILWRLHFIGGFLAAPVVVAMAVTGILFAWNPQIDDVRFGEILNAPTPEVNVSLAEQVAAASEAHPTWDIYSVTPGTDGTNTQVMMDPPGGEQGFGGPADGVYVYVNQTDGSVTGDVAKENLSGSILRGWHSSFGIGEKAEPITELAGSWLVVSLLTGLYLWWPSLRRLARQSISWRKKETARGTSKTRHNAIGMLLFIPMLMLAITGLTWTQYAGERLDLLKEAVGADAQPEPVSLEAPSEEQTNITNIDTVYSAIDGRDMVSPVQITPPTEADQPWNVRSQDSTYPLQRDQLLVDGSTGEVVKEQPYADEHWFNQLRTAGILFHQAELFGAPLQVFLTIVSLGAIALIVYGYKMWWARKPADGFGTPPAVRNWLRNAPVPILIAALALAWLLPVLGVSVIIFLVGETLARAALKLRNKKIQTT